MIRRLGELNERWKAQGRAPIAIGIGINTGTVIFGNLGRGKKSSSPLSAMPSISPRDWRV